MIEMPELKSYAVKRSPWPGIGVVAVMVGLLAGAFYLLSRQRGSEIAAGVAPTVPIAAAAAETAAPSASGTPAAPSLAVAAPVAAAAEKGIKSLSVELNGALEASVVASAGKAVGAPLTQVINRSLVWWIRVPRDIVKGDTLDVVYEERAQMEPLVHAVRFHSRKLDKTFEAFRLPKNGRLYLADGTELEERLVDGPLETYEQITSLLKDGRKHKGVDFKTPVGTPVKATFTGTVVRKNWNFRGNGNSLEINEVGGKGRTALFLHLSELPKTIQAGSQVKRGDVIAKSGNTGHSFAPHLHYQLMKGDTVLDPFESHSTHRISVATDDRAALDDAMATMRQKLPPLAPLADAAPSQSP